MLDHIRVMRMLEHFKHDVQLTYKKWDAVEYNQNREREI